MEEGNKDLRSSRVRRSDEAKGKREYTDGLVIYTKMLTTGIGRDK